MIEQHPGLVRRHALSAGVPIAAVAAVARHARASRPLRIAPHEGHAARTELRALQRGAARTTDRHRFGADEDQVELLPVLEALAPVRVKELAIHAVQGGIQPGGRHIVLVLPDTDGLGVDLHQLRQRVLEPPGDGHRRPEVHVVLGELLRRQRACGVHGGPRLGDDHVADVGSGIVDLPDQLHRHLLRLPAGGAVADGDVLHMVLQGYYGGLYTSNFNRFGKIYRVMIQGEQSQRANYESLYKVKVRNNKGEMCPITEFMTLTPTKGPDVISRFNLFTSIAINGNPADGYTSGQAIEAIERCAKENLPVGYSYEFSGLTREEAGGSSGGTGLVFILCFIFIYLLLSAQYESYILPLAVLLSVPFGLAGSFIFVWLMGGMSMIPGTVGQCMRISKQRFPRQGQVHF